MKYEVSLPPLNDLPRSGAELPDSLQRNADQPGSLSAKRFLRLRPKTRIHEKPVLPVRSQQAHRGALAQEEDISHHGEINYGFWCFLQEALSLCQFCILFSLCICFFALQQVFFKIGEKNAASSLDEQLLNSAPSGFFT